MARFNTNTFRSLNESIARIQNPQAALDEAMEYTSILETVILDLCEALDLDPQALLEDLQTPERDYEMYSSIRKKKQAANKHRLKAKDTSTPARKRAAVAHKLKAKDAAADARKLKATDAAEKADKENVYGTGGKVVDTRTAYNQRVNRKWTAADKKEWERTHYNNKAREIEYDDSRSTIDRSEYKR
jgi:hypothetical protein